MMYWLGKIAIGLASAYLILNSSTFHNRFNGKHTNKNNWDKD